MPKLKPKRVSLSTEREWRQSLQEIKVYLSQESLISRRVMPDEPFREYKPGETRAIYVERYGRIPRGKSKMWAEHWRAASESHERVNILERCRARVLGKRSDWADQDYPGNNALFRDPSGIERAMCLGSALGLQDVRGGEVLW